MRSLACVLLAAFTLLAFSACEEKKKPAGDNSLKGEAKPSEALAGGEGACSYSEGSPITREAVFLKNQEDPNGLAVALFRLVNGKEILVNGDMPDDLKKGNKVYVTYKEVQLPFDTQCWNIKRLVSLKRVGGECSKEGSPITIEAIFLAYSAEGEGLARAFFQLANNEEITLNGETPPEDVKKGDKVSVTYKEMHITFPDAGCLPIKHLESLKKIGK